MAGDDPLARTLAQISRLTDRPTTADELIALRSVHRATLAAWGRKEGLAFDEALLGARAPFTVAALLRLQPGAPSPPPVAAASAAEPDAGPPGAGLPGAAGAVGLDIEEVAALPHAEDYREEPFYRDNFTPAEIAYCLRQADVRASFCGLWAAKEAVTKAGMAPIRGTALRHVEIGRDDQGRPTYAGCAISVSHTRSTAVAVCLAAPNAPQPAPVGPATLAAPVTPERPARKRPSVSAIATLAGAALGAVAGFLVGHF